MKSEEIEKHQPTRKWGSSKYSSREMPRYSEEEKKKMGIITGKLRPKPEQENKQLKNIMEQDEKVKYAAFREIKRLIDEKEITFNKHDKWCAESITLKQKLEKINELDLELIQFYLEKLFRFYVNEGADKSTTDQLHEKLEQLRNLKKILQEK